MGASKLLKKALIDEGLTQKQFSELIGKDPQQVRNAIYRDSFQFNLIESWFDAIGYEIVIRKKATDQKVID